VRTPPAVTTFQGSFRAGMNRNISANNMETRSSDMVKSIAANSPTTAACDSAMRALMLDRPVDTVSETISKNPSVRMKPSERNRRRSQPPSPPDLSTGLCQMTCNE